MIELDGICLTLGGREVLRDVSLRVRPGQTCALGGDSGAGKTSLLRVLLGALRAHRGRVRVASLALEPANLAQIRARQFYLPQQIRPRGDESVAHYLELPFSLRVNRGLRYDAGRARELARQLRLADGALEQRMAELSGGERRRVGLLRGLLLDRPLMLLDEPTGAVDADGRAAVVELLLADEARTVLAATHDEALTARADIRARLDAGRLALQE